MERAGQQVLGESFSLDGVVVAGGLDPWIFSEAARTSGLEISESAQEAFRSVLLGELVRELAITHPPPAALPGVLELLRELRAETAATLGLLTGNFPHTGAAKLEAAGIDPEWFEISVWGDEAPDRPALVALAMERHRVARRKDVIVIGDTPRDVQCALAHGCRALAVATGGYSVQDLLAAGASAVVADLRNPEPLWRMLREP